MPEVKKVRYTHDAIIDVIIANPAVSQGDLAKEFGFTEAWMSIIVNSDSFKEKLAIRKAELTDPKITASIEMRLEGLAKKSLDRLLDRVDSSIPLKPMELVAMAKLGVGNRADRIQAPVTQNNNLYVLQMPAQSKDSSEWLKSSGKAPLPGPAAQGGTLEMRQNEAGVYSVPGS